MQSILVVGASLAGLSAARAARRLGFEGRLTVVGAEPHRPYDRPPLSKELLAGAVDETEVGLESEGEALDVEWRLNTTAARLDPTTTTVTTDDGTELRADGIVLATGGFAAVPPALATAAGGRTPVNLTALRTLEDGRWLRSRLVPGCRLVIVGAGLIGSEVAATARALGCEVAVVDLEPNPLARLYGSTLAAPLSNLHARHGVAQHHGVGIAEIGLQAESVSHLVLSDGQRLETDVVLVAVGARPAIGWLAGSGLDLGDGVVCDADGRTGRPGIVAVGDCAAWYDRHLERPHRSQHWTDALERPVAAVAALLGVPAPPRRSDLPYFWSDQYGEKIQMAGYASLADEVEVLDGDPEAGPFLALYRRAGEPVAVLGVSKPREFVRWRKTITQTMATVEVATRPATAAAPAVAAPAPR